MLSAFGEVCPDNGNDQAAAKITEEQLLDIILKFIREHPEVRHTAAAPLARIALTAAFPCSHD
jgi:hypothetical protein